MSETPLRKEDPARLENRLAIIEERLTAVHISNQTVTLALSHVSGQLKEIKQLAEWAIQTDRKFESYRATQMLAQASKIFPKSRSVVFVSKGYFGDNIKYAWLAFHEYARGKDVAVHFLVDDPRQRELLTAAGLPCLSADPHDWSVEDIRVLFGAKVVVLDDNLHTRSMKHPQAYGMLQGAKKIQIWHGIPVKEIGLHYVLRGDKVILDELLASSGTFDMFVAPAAAARDDWAQRFAFRNFAATGYPRNDVFFREPTTRDLLNVDREVYDLFRAARKAGKPAIIYTPTYRDDTASVWFPNAGIDKLALHAEAKGYVLAVNLHPYEQVLLDDWHARFPNIRFVAPGTDIYPIVRESDILITDYSSLAFDFLMLDRPLIFYRPNGDRVVVKERGFITSMIHETPGGTASSVEDLIRAVDTAVGFARASASDPHRTARHALRIRLFDHVDGKAAERLCGMVMGMVEDK